MQQETMEVTVVETTTLRCAKLQSDHYYQYNYTLFPNSVKALKAIDLHLFS